MTRLSYWDLHLVFKILKFCIHFDILGSANNYTTWKEYWYFTPLIDDAIYDTWVYFMKIVSDALSILREFVLSIEQNFNLRICILHTNISQFNSDASAKYLSQQPKSFPNGNYNQILILPKTP